MNNSAWRDSELPNNSPLPESGDELFWTAFQYAVGELADGEAVRFEERLADDQRAREALASAVALLEEVRVAESVASPVCIATGSPVVSTSQAVEPVRRAVAERTFWQSPAMWFVGGAAACLALFFAGPFTAGPNASSVRNDSESERRLAFAWGESQLADDDANTIPDDGLLIVAAEDPNPDDMGDADDDLPSLNDRPTAPDWLIAAVAETHTADSQE